MNDPHDNWKDLDKLQRDEEQPTVSYTVNVVQVLLMSVSIVLALALFCVVTVLLILIVRHYAGLL